MSAVKRPPGEQRFRMSCVSWEGYVHLGKAFADRHVRTTYDRGELEFMTVSFGHERDKHLLSRLVDVLTEEMDIEVAGGGSTTLDREDLERGLEGDECWWIEHEPLVRHHRKIDLERDPPPDLALEVEITRSLLNRIAIYAALKVPEVWRWDGKVLTFLALDENGTYAAVTHSRSFPFLASAELQRFLRMSATKSETQAVRAFRAWAIGRADEWRTGNAGHVSKKRRAR